MTTEEGGERRVVDINAGMGGPYRSKAGGTKKTRRTWEQIQVKQWGRWTRHSFQHRSIPAAADHGETGGNDSDGTFRETPLPLGGGW